MSQIVLFGTFDHATKYAESGGIDESCLSSYCSLLRNWLPNQKQDFPQSPPRKLSQLLCASSGKVRRDFGRASAAAEQMTSLQIHLRSGCLAGSDWASADDEPYNQRLVSYLMSCYKIPRLDNTDNYSSLLDRGSGADCSRESHITIGHERFTLPRQRLSPEACAS